MSHAKANQVFIISAPSGAGKSSLLKEVLAADTQLALSISHTTRAMRPGEEQGVHYHFIEQTQFAEMRDQGHFLEHAQVFDNFYGTAETSVRDQLQAGKDVVVEIDWQGARQVRERFPQAVSIFIAPPSIEALRERLSNRGQDSEEIIERRMRDARSEMSHFDEYDYLVINDDFSHAVSELLTIIKAQRLSLEAQKSRHQTELAAMLAE